MAGHIPLCAHSHALLATVLVTIGQIKGQTLLPLPPQATLPQAAPAAGTGMPLKDQDKIHILESAIVTWTKQIKLVLKADPDTPLKVGVGHCGPWERRGLGGGGRGGRVREREGLGRARKRRAPLVRMRRGTGEGPL